MGKKDFRSTIDELTGRAFWEVQNVIACIPDELWEKNYCEMPLWKHVYHTLHSLDCWYINPFRYEEPAFHTPGLNNLNVPSDDLLTRETLEEYFKTIRKKIKEYHAALTEEELLICPEGSPYTRFALILGQYRHLHTHLGILMGFIIAETGKWPYVLGLTHEFPEDDPPLFYE